MSPLPMLDPCSGVGGGAGSMRCASDAAPNLAAARTAADSTRTVPRRRSSMCLPSTHDAT